MTESTSDAPPSVWFPSVLEYGGGTMHHAALRGDVEAIAKLAVDGTPVRARGGARRESSARASRRNDVSRAGTRRGFGRRDASACRRADRGFGARGGGADRAWSPRERGGRLGRDAAALHGRQSPDAWRDRGPRERCRRESSTAGDTHPPKERARRCCFFPLTFARARCRRGAKAPSASRATRPSTLLAGDGSTMWRCVRANATTVSLALVMRSP